MARGSGVDMATDTTPRIRYAVLGTIAVMSNDHLDAVAGRQQLLLAQLLVEHGTTVSTDRLVHAVWGDDLPRHPAAALRSQVARLRRRLPRPTDLTTVHGGYRLDVPRAELDATRFEDLVAAASGVDHRRALQLLDEALALWHGTAFGSVADREFAYVEAVRLDELRVGSREQRSEHLIALGEVGGAVSDLTALLDERPQRERTRALLMEALYRQGRHTAALELYQTRREELAERGLEPAPELRRLEEAILMHQLPPSPSTQGPHSLPRPITSFVGRDEDVDRLVADLDQARLLTLCGPGGVGKTRLALEAGDHWEREHPDQICYCDLAALERGGQVTRAVAIAVGAKHLDRRPLDDQLIEHLSGRHALVVLDNCEHVLDDAAQLADRLLRHTADVRLLATSRERLGVDGENVIDVAPLQVEGPDAPSVRLFMDRARVSAPDVDFGADDLANASVICRQLDGLPLAIELAASSLRAMTTGELAGALDHPVDLLMGGPRSTPRHRSLRSVIEWSYGRLEEPQQRLFDTLSVFVGPFDLNAVATITGNTPSGSHIVASRVRRLVDCSLLSARHDDGATTFHMLVTLRSYGQERLEASGRREEVRDRHGRWAIEFAEAAEAGLRGPEEASWVRRVKRHFDDLRAAQEWLVGHDLEGAFRLSAALHPFATWRGHSEVFHWAEVAAAAAGATRGRQSPLLPAVLGSAATGMVQRGDLDAAEATAKAAIRAAPTNSTTARRGRQALADVRLRRGDIREAVDLYLRCCESALADDDLPQAVWDLGSAALAHAYAGELSLAVEPAEETVRLARKSENPSALAFAQFTAGEIAAINGDGQSAETHLQRAIDQAASCDSRFVDGIARVTLATVHARASHPAEALDHYTAAITQWRQAGIWAPQWVTLRHLVDLLARHGAATEAATLYGAVTSPRTGAAPYGADLERLEDVRDRLAATLGPAAFDRHSERGSTLAANEIITLAVDAISDVRSTLPRSEDGGRHVMRRDS